ncbi:MAG: ABC transporter permease subunit [Streptosporangiaceae bacterium]|jgi:ABC-2 type transport system permease protein
MQHAEHAAWAPGHPAVRSPVGAIVRLTARRAVRSGVIWGYIFGVSIASSAVSYPRLYKTKAQRDALAATFGSDKATSALFGPAPQLQTVAGFTAFKISMTLMLLGAVWGLLTSTRLLRGEEDNGRWELLLAGPYTRAGATAQALAGLAAGVLTLWAITGLLTVLTGLDSAVGIAARPAMYFALAMVATAVMFLAVGALTSQVAGTRRQAAAQAAWFLGASYAVRLVADAGLGLHGLIWASPLGWVEELQPLTRPQPAALVPVAVFTAVLAAAAVRLAGRRDVGAGLVPDRASRRSQLPLGGPAALAVRLVRPAVAGWWVAIAISALLFGLIARSAGGTISGSSVQQVFAKLGASGSGAAAVLGVCFLILAVLVACTAAGQLTAARAEESAGRLEHLLARPVSRGRWLAGRLLVAIVVLLASGVLAGVCGWAGAASQHAGVSFTAMLKAGVNLTPPAIIIAGIGVLAFGVRPRITSAVVYSLLGWSLLVLIIGSIGSASRWVLDTSVFHQMGSAPATSPHWAADGVMTAIGVAAALIGGIAFARRDLQAE